MKKIGVIFQKEIVDNLRDYRSLITGLIWSVFGPLLMGVMIMLVGRAFRIQVEDALRLPVMGGENAPNLVAFLARQNVITEPAPADPRSAVIAGDVNVVLIIPKEYADDFSAGKQATLQLVYDSSRQSALVDIQRIKLTLESYNKYMGTLRLTLRGISPEVTNVVLIEAVDTATPQSQTMIFLAMMPYFIIMAIFTGASPLIIDATPGERERGSLEPLLINPLPRSWVANAKMMAAMPFALFGMVITLVGFAAVFTIFPVDQLLGMQIGFDAGSLIAIFLICLPVVYLACAIQTMVASFTRTPKEAGTYLPFIALVPALPGLALGFLSVKPSLWMMLIPTFGQQVLINQILRGEPIQASYVVITTVFTLLTSVAFTYGAVKLYEKERIFL
jgi:sodium transport system permease protein